MQLLWQIIRRLARTKGFTVVAVLMLGIGIGANTAIFGIVNAVLIKPLPYPDSDRLIWLNHRAPGVNIEELQSSPFLFFIEREQNETFDGVGLFGASTTSVTGLAEPESVDAAFVTSDMLPLLGVEPLIGRYFSAGDDLPGAAATVILSYAYWQRRFAADTDVIGQSLTTDGEVREIVGVMPQSFSLPMSDADLFMPYQLDREQTTTGGYFWNSVARLKPGVTLEAASQDVARLIPIAIDAFPIREGATRQQLLNVRLGPNLRPLKQEVVGDIGRTLWILMGTIGIVLLIACANIANLLLVRAEGRQHELAIRRAMGAGRGRIVRELLLESMTLGLLGGVLGVALAYLGLQALLRFIPGDLPRLAEITLGPTVLTFALAASLMSGLLFGSIPALKYAGQRLDAVLRSGGRAQSASRERHRARGALVTLQVALAIVLLVSAGLMIRTFVALSDLDPGFARPHEVLSVSIDIPPTAVREAERVTRVQQTILERIAALPGVDSVAFTSSAPMGGATRADLIVIEGREFSDGNRPEVGRLKFISPDLFRTTGTPLLMGRELTWSDLYDKRPVALVSESLARREWGSASEAMGKRLRGGTTTDDWREIVGIVGNVRDDGIVRPPPEIFYLPALVDRIYNLPTLAYREVTYLIRSPRTGTPALLEEIRAAIWSINPDLPLANVQTLGRVYERSLARTSVTLTLLALAGAMALLLGVVGIYGVIAYAVSQSTREIGIRMALGAQHRSVRRLFVRHALLLAALGVALGLAAAAGVTRLMSSLLFGVSALDPVTYIAVSALLIVAVALASYVPARHATRVNPMVALRAE